MSWGSIVEKVIDKLEIKKVLGSAILGMLELLLIDNYVKLEESIYSVFKKESSSWLTWFTYSGITFFIILIIQELVRKVQDANYQNHKFEEDKQLAINNINDLPLDSQMVLLHYMKNENSFIEDYNHDHSLEYLKFSNYLIERPLKIGNDCENDSQVFYNNPFSKYKLKESVYEDLKELFVEKRYFKITRQKLIVYFYKSIKIKNSDFQENS